MGCAGGPAGTVLRKKRHMVHRDGVLVAIDEHQDGTFVAEIDDGDQLSKGVPDWLDIVEDVSNEERWTGACLARCEAPCPRARSVPVAPGPPTTIATTMLGSWPSVG